MAKFLMVVPEWNYNGITTQVSHLAEILPQLGHEVQVAALTGSEFRSLQDFGTLHIEILSDKHRWELGALWKFRKLVKQFQPDLIHAFSPTSLRLVHLALGRTACPVLAGSPLTPTERGYRLNWLDRLLLQKSAGVVVSGNAEADACRRLQLQAKEIFVIPPGVFNCNELSTEGENDIVCVGPLVEGKGYEYTVWAYDVIRRLIPDLRLWIVGTGPMHGKLKKFVRTLLLEDFIHFVDPCADVRPYLRRARLVWSLSKIERGKNVLLETMALGKPVVASNLRGYAEIVNDGETGFLVPPGDIDAISRRTRLLLDNAPLRREMGQAARSHVQAWFAISRMQQSYLQIYAEAVGTGDEHFACSHHPMKIESSKGAVATVYEANS